MRTGVSEFFVSTETLHLVNVDDHFTSEVIYLSQRVVVPYVLVIDSPISKPV